VDARIELAVIVGEPRGADRLELGLERGTGDGRTGRSGVVGWETGGVCGGRGVSSSDASTCSADGNGSGGSAVSSCSTDSCAAIARPPAITFSGTWPRTVSGRSDAVWPTHARTITSRPIRPLAETAAPVTPAIARTSGSARRSTWLAP
jgi:hypothetical protein